MKNTLFLLFALLGATLYAQPAQQLLDEAITLSTQGDYVASNNLLTTLIDQYPTRKYDLSEAAFLKSENHLALGNLEYAKIANELSLELHQAIIPEEVGRNLLQAGIIAVAAANYEEALKLLSQAEQYPFIDAPATPAEIKFLKGMAYEQLAMPEASVDAIREGIAIQEIVGDIDKARSLEDFKALLRLKPVDHGMLNSLDVEECTNWYLLSKVSFGEAEALKKASADNQDIEALKKAYHLIARGIEAFEHYTTYLSPDSQQESLIEESKTFYDLGIALSLRLSEVDNEKEYTLNALNLAERAKWLASELKTSPPKDEATLEKELQYKAQYNAAINHLALHPGDSTAEALVLKERNTYIDYLNNQNIRVLPPAQSISEEVSLTAEHLGRREALVYYYVGTEAAYVAVGNKSGMKLYPIADLTSLKEKLLTFDTIAEGEEKKQFACSFFDPLLAPVSKDIRSKKSLLIYPNEQLTSLPFEIMLKECTGENGKQVVSKRLSVKVIDRS